MNLKQEHPDKFEEAKQYEKTALAHGSPFSWSDSETLEHLGEPERILQIQKDYSERQNRQREKILKRMRLQNPYYDDTVTDAEISDWFDIDEVYGVSEISSSCIICHK